MAASQIPNLSTFRRGGSRGRGRGPGGTPTGKRDTQDEIIQRTDNDAATSRLSAIDAGYLDDPFAKHLTSSSHVERRLPLMNRGTYARTTAIDQIVETFLTTAPEGRKQIISLGAGSDTRCFRIRQRHRGIDLVYHELDFETNTKSKIAQMTASRVFMHTAKGLCGLDFQSPDVLVTEKGSRLAMPDYNIHPQDLRKLPEISTPLAGVDVTLPTLLISECCLIYLSPAEADAVLEYFTNLFPPNVALAMTVYEPIRPHDGFGRTMVSNLTARGIQLQTLEKYAGLSAQRERLKRYGFGLLVEDGQTEVVTGGAAVADVDFIWQKWLEEKEKERIEALEWMDEVEEFILFARHYCVAWGWRGFPDSQGWRGLPAQPGD